MSVFIVRHQHPAGRCPAADFTAGAGLLNQLSGLSATRHGVRIRGEAALAAHTLVMIAEADGEDVLRAFLRPFKAAGTVEVEPASTRVQVVAGGGCGSALPAADRQVRAVDPEEACTAALAAGLVVRRAYPLNCETPLPALTGVVMPNARFYVRNHFGIPDLDPGGWRLRVRGLVGITPTPPPGTARRRVPQVTMSGNYVGKTMPPDQSGITVYATVRGMTAARLPTPARCRRRPPRPARPYPPPGCRAGAA
jgi:hypothetical protein